MDFQELKEKAKKQIAPYMQTLFLISLLYVVLVFLNRYLKITYKEYPSTFLGFEYTAKKSFNFGSFLFLPVLGLGNNVIYLNLTRGIAPKIKDFFLGFKDWWSIIKLHFVSQFFITCWMFLFIIPGFVKIYSYSMATYILAENKGMKACDAIGISRQMMTGHKMELFMLDLSLTGYTLLNIITLGIASIWIRPYLSAVRANFYTKLKARNYKIKSIPVYDN
ncbi:MAG: DUF975 family protein [Clostridia bacterium]|nr:DUF975 family protein [Clostridia bacterium]